MHTGYSVHTMQNWHRGGRGKNPAGNLGEKKTARHARGTAGGKLFDTHQLRALVIPHPDLLGAVVTNAEVEAFKEI